METCIWICADLRGEVKHMSMQFMGIQTYIQKDRNNLLRVSPDSQAKLVDRSLAAINDKVKRLVLALKLICHIVICLGSIYPGNDFIQVLTADLLSIFQVKLVLEDFLFSWQDTDYVHIRNHKRVRVCVPEEVRL